MTDLSTLTLTAEPKAVKAKTAKPERHTPTQVPLPARSQAEFNAWMADTGHLERERAKLDTLRDLVTRWNKADEIARKAEAAGNDDLFERAIMRLFYRGEQWRYAEAREIDAVCQPCAAGEEAWSPDFWKSELPQWACLEHADAEILSRTVDQYAIWESAASRPA